MNRKYNLKLDLQFRCNNSTMKFDEFDNNTSDFFIRVTRAGELIDISKAIVTLVVIKPDNSVDAQFVDIDSNRAYCDLKPTMKNLVGKYEAIASITVDGETVNTGIDNPIIYEVTENKFLRQLNQKVVTEERFTLLTDMINRLSTIEISEEQRVINEAERILSEENRKIEEAKRVEAELIRQHEEADRAKYDATRESNENIRKQNESIRLANETNRIDEEVKRVEEENKRKLAEEERNANYNFMTEDEDRRRSEANAHKEAEKLRAQAEITRVNEEAKRRTTEQARVSAENTRVNNENIRKTNEETRQNNETKRVEAETQRQNRYNSFITDAEANASNFENYTNTAKVKEEERKSNELDRKSQEARRVSNEVERISNENTRKANEVVREKNEASRQNTFTNKVNEVDKKIIEINTTKDNFVSSINTKVDTKISELNTTKDNFVSSVNTKVDSKISELDNTKSDMATSINNKVNEVENRFNALTSKQQQDAEVIDARDGETSLKARLDRDIEKAKQVYVNVEGSYISTDSSVGYLKDVKILGNTIQSASNLADIRSVGDKIEGQELYEIPVLSVGKNLFDGIIEMGDISATGEEVASKTATRTSFIRIKKGINYVVSGNRINSSSWTKIMHYDINKKFIATKYSVDSTVDGFIKVVKHNPNQEQWNFQIEEGTQPTPYEPYIEDKLTILSPVQLEKVGDIADRLIEKGGVWGVEKNIKTVVFDGTVVNGDVSSNFPSDNSSMFYIVFTDTANDSVLICDKFPNKNISHISNRNVEGVFVSVNGSNNAFYFRIFNDKLPTQDVQGFKQWLSENNVTIKYKTVNPSFIPLPHDQQIKLRTFANKTNISFLTEIEGTIKAQVPKSLGATVNTHTEQINNLNKELDRVKKLEESTVSIVTTESGFTTVEATSNGYFEDVKLEGKTLVNLAKQPTNNGSINNQYATISTVTNIKPSTEYTYIIRNNGSETLKLYLNHNGGFDWFDLDVEANSTVIGKARTLPTIDGDIWLSLSKAETAEQNLQVVLLEGDHTQNTPSYFEGLKSVGDGADEIVVSSVKGDGNLFDKKNIHLNKFLQANGDETSVEGWFVSDYIKVADTCYIKGLINIASSNLARICVYNQNKTFKTLLSQPLNTTLNISSFIENGDYIRITEKIEQVDSIVVCKNEISNQIYQSDKKRLLYYNEETQAWEKPILREWDSIEKHANGKYYYHQRSGEGVFDGSEDEKWWDTSEYGSERENTLEFRGHANNILRNLEKNNLVCDKFNFVANIWNKDAEGIGCVENNSIDIRIPKSKLSTQDTAGFKQWLQANNVTVVYQLAQEKVYECTNIDLITYANETNYVVESGVLSPRTTLKVHNNISNVVSLLQKKVSLLESNVTSYMITQNRLMLASRYNADNVTFKVDYPSMMSEREVEIDYDLFKLIQDNIIVGPENYDVDKMLEIMDLYAMIGFITWEMWDYLYEVIDIQINPVIGDLEGAPEI